jgi:hypothetical protein
MRRFASFAAALTLGSVLVMACSEDDPVDITGTYTVDFEWDFVSDSLNQTGNIACFGTITVFEQAGGDFDGNFSTSDPDCDFVSGGTFSGTVGSDGTVTTSDLYEEFFALEQEVCVLTGGTTEMRGQLSGDDLTLRAVGEWLCNDFGVYDITVDFQVSGTRQVT